MCSNHFFFCFFPRHWASNGTCSRCCGNVRHSPHVQAEDADKLAVAHTNRQVEEDRKAKGRAQQEAGKACNAPSVISTPSSSHSGLPDATLQRVRPARKAAAPIVMPLGSRKLIGSSRGEQSASSRREPGQHRVAAAQRQAWQIGGARASAAARARCHFTWGKKESVLGSGRKKLPHREKMPKPPPNPLLTMKTALNYLNVSPQSLHSLKAASTA